MFRFTLTLILFLISLLTANCFANTLTLSVKQFSQKLEQYHFSKQDSFHNELNQINATYVHGVGAVFNFQYRQPLQVWQMMHQGETETIEHYTPFVDPTKAQAKFNQLRLEAKNLSHQAFSLERQLKSMKQSIGKLSGEQKEAHQQKILMLEKELKRLENNKALLKPKYDHAEALAKQSSTNEPVVNTINKASYLDDVEQFIVNYGCQQANINQVLPEQEKLVFIFTAAGSEQQFSDEITHFQDINFTLNITDINACINGKLTETELRNKTIRHYF